MVSVKSFMKVFQAFVCLMLLSSAAVYAASTPDLDVEIKECEGSYESRVMCERTLGDGSTQTGSGWCKCSRGKLSGGCSLPAATYTEIRFGITTGQECRDCTVPSVTRGCGISAVVDETPTCGNWYSCGAVVEPDDPIIPIVKDCTSGQVQYKPSGSCGTSERTCCSNGTWSGWDAECSGASSCGTNQCWNGSACVSKGETSRSCVGNVLNTTGGSQTRTATCTSSGWSYGEWSGTCTCKNGYNWFGAGCLYQTGGGGDCSSKTCPSGQHAVNAINGCCCEYDNCGKTLANNTVGYCKCAQNSADPWVGI